MNEIVLAKIDETISKQKNTSLRVESLNIDTIVICDDEISEDSFFKALIEFTIPFNVKSAYLKVSEIKKFTEESSSGRILLIVKNPETLLKIKNEGVKIKEVDISYMKKRKDGAILCEDVFLKPDDFEIFEKIKKDETNIFLRKSPQGFRRPLDDFLRA